MASTDLCKDEVKRRLGSYEDDGVTDELYGFGTMLVHDAVDRLSKINGTAGAIAAYCAGLITILTSTATIWAKGIGPWERFLPIGSAAFAGLAAALAISSMSLRKLNWFSQDDWLNSYCLTRDGLRSSTFCQCGRSLIVSTPHIDGKRHASNVLSILRPLPLCSYL